MQWFQDNDRGLITFLPSACWPNKPSFSTEFSLLTWGMGITPKLYCGYRLHPHHALLSCLELCLGRTTLILIKAQTLYYTYLSTPLEVDQPLLEDDEHEGKESHDQTVASVTKHHSKQERERDDSVGSCM